MEIISVMIACVLSTLLAAKKSVFGQMTLTNNRALDFLKEGMKIEIAKIEIGDASAFKEDYNLPTTETVGWDVQGWIAILFGTEEWLNPVLVTQKSVLAWLDSEAADWEQQTGNKAKGITRNKKAVMQLIFGKEKPLVEFSRVSKKKMAPYTPRVVPKKK